MIHIPQDLIKQIIAHAEQEYPNEACGILAGKEGKVEKVYQMVNQDKSAKSFFMDPKEQLKVMKEIRGAGLEMVGIYHSHPETGASPSAHDVELAYYPDASYVIVSLMNKDKPVIKSFRIVNSKIEEEAIGYKS